jgi:hypothetical protein
MRYIGTSLGRCLRSILLGEVSSDQVFLISTGTRSETKEQYLGIVKQYYQERFGDYDITQWSWEEVEKLAALGCRDNEIANFFGIKDDTLRNNFSDNLTKGREDLKITLRRAMLNNACRNNNAAVQIFLAKNILGMSDNGMESDDKKPLPWSDE